MSSKLITSTLLLVCLTFADKTFAKEISIDNGLLKLSYQETDSSVAFEYLDCGKVFVSRATLSGQNGKAAVETIMDDTFGRGKQLKITYPDKDEDSLNLFDAIPFVFIQHRFYNHTDIDRRIEQIDNATFHLDLGIPCQKLAVLGTGGLEKCDEHLEGSYAFAAIADPETRHGVVTAWLTSDRGSGIMFPATENNKISVRAELQYGRLLIPPGHSAAGEILVVGYFDDARLGLEQYADLVAQHYKIKLPPQISGYCTWYSIPNGRASDEKHTAQLSRFVAKELKPFGFSFIQIDDKWQAGKRQGSSPSFSAEYLGKPPGWSGEKLWCDGPNSNFTTYNPDGPYPNGMKGTADLISSLGLRAGLWMTPFAWNPLSDPLIDHHNWFVKQPNGYLYYCRWAGWPLDMSNPEARDFLRNSIERIVDKWGYRYLKLDGMWAAMATKLLYTNNGYQKDDLGTAVVHNPYMTPVEIYRKGMETVRKAAGKDVFILGCTVAQNMRTMSASFGLVDSIRIGPDHGCKWKALKRGAQAGSNRYFFNKRVWYNDPDPIYVRKSMPLQHAQLICSWAAISGQMTVCSDWLPEIPSARLDIIKRAMPTHQAVARPVDLFETEIPRIWTLTGTTGKTRRDVIGLFNWDDKKSIHIERSADELGLPKSNMFVGFDFWSNRFVAPFSGNCSFDVPAASCRVISLRPLVDHPKVVSTSRHITQGVIDLLEESWNPSTKTLSGTSKVVGNDPYELRIVATKPTGKWKALSTQVSSKDKSGNVTIKITEQTDWTTRVLIKSEISRSVNWQIRFSSV